MTRGITFQLDDTAFQAALVQYAEVSRRTIPDICNKKALFIARGALRNTPRVPVSKIEEELGKIVRVTDMGKRGHLVKRSALAGVFGKSGPLAALILTAKRSRLGQDSIFKGKTRAQGRADMAKAVLAFVRDRRRSVAFLASGWIQAIRTLSPLVKGKAGIPAFTPGVRQWGRRKGEAKPATQGWSPAATIVNQTGITDEESRALAVYGIPALQQAINTETASMLEEVEKRMKEGAHEAGIQTR